MLWQGNLAQSLFLYLNYFQHLQNPEKFSDAKLVSNSKLWNYARKPHIKDWYTLTNEEGTLGVSEVVMDKKTITDHYPVHVGNSILQYAKLHMLQ